MKNGHYSAFLMLSFCSFVNIYDRKMIQISIPEHSVNFIP